MAQLLGLVEGIVKADKGVIKAIQEIIRANLIFFGLP